MFGRPISVFNANYQFNPVYIDEMSLLKFTEEFLDTVIENGYKKIVVAKNSSNKILQEVMKLLEIDRIQLKYYNHLVS